MCEVLSPNHYSGHKRKLNSSEHTTDEPPQKRRKSNGIANEFEENNGDGSQHCLSPPLIMFSPQISSDNEDENEYYSESTSSSSRGECYNFERMMHSHYNPDIIQGLEYLIPSARFNPFFDASSISLLRSKRNFKKEIVDSPKSVTQSLASSCSPSLTSDPLTNINSFDGVKLNEEEEEDDDECNRGNVDGGGPPINEMMKESDDGSDDNNNNNNNVIELLSDDSENNDENVEKDANGHPNNMTEIEKECNDDNENVHTQTQHNAANKQSEFMRYPHMSPKPVIITIGDLGRLRPMTYLNDSIIDFYLKYVFRELLNDEQRNDIHIFNQFFFTKLESAINEKNERARLKLSKWTKNVNIFEKKVLIIPINNALHWSLAIITNPGYAEPLRMEDEEQTNYEYCKNTLFSIISHSVCNEPKWVNTLKTNAKILAITNYPKKILHFDSMRGCHPTNEIYQKLRIYLCDEWQRQYNDEKVFDVDNMPGVSLGVPQQTNSADCGVYLLHFAQLFTLAPFYNSGNSVSRNEWFTSSDIEQKRNDIKALCIKLRRKQGKIDLDIDGILDRLQITVQSQSGMHSHFNQEGYDKEEEEDDFEEEDERTEFEDRLWEIEEDLLKDRLITKARDDPHFYHTLTQIVNDIEIDQNMY